MGAPVAAAQPRRRCVSICLKRYVWLTLVEISPVVCGVGGNSRCNENLCLRSPSKRPLCSQFYAKWEIFARHSNCKFSGVSDVCRGRFLLEEPLCFCVCVCGSKMIVYKRPLVRQHSRSPLHICICSRVVGASLKFYLQVFFLFFIGW